MRVREGERDCSSTRPRLRSMRRAHATHPPPRLAEPAMACGVRTCRHDATMLSRFALRRLIPAALFASIAPLVAVEAPTPAPDLWYRKNLVAWCIVPFDTKKRDATARATMLDELRIRQLAYDWRAEHAPFFDEEVTTMARHGITLVAWWFPGQLDANARRILEVIARHQIHPQLWVTIGNAARPAAADPQARVVNAADRLRPIVEAAAKLGCRVGLYNHGGWFGEPENQLAILERLRSAGLQRRSRLQFSSRPRPHHAIRRDVASHPSPHPGG